MTTSSGPSTSTRQCRRRWRRHPTPIAGGGWIVRFVVVVVVVVVVAFVAAAGSVSDSGWESARSYRGSAEVGAVVVQQQQGRRALGNKPARATGCLLACCRNCGPSSTSATKVYTSTVSATAGGSDVEASGAIMGADEGVPYVTLTMEGIGNNAPVGSFYQSRYGVTFDKDALALVDDDAGGSGNFAFEPSPSTALQFYTKDTIVMNVANGGVQTGMSFYYSSITRNGSVTAYDGPNGTGNVLASQDFYPLGFYRNDGDPRGDFNRWRGIGLAWDEGAAAQSVVFKGAVNRMLIDDITLGSATSSCPDNATMSTFELWNGATDSRTSVLKEGGAYCLRGNWNIRVKTVHEMATCGPVLIKFFTGSTSLRRKVEDQPSYFLFGDDPVTRNVYGNTNLRPKVSSLPLANGTTYCVRSTEGNNRPGFSQVCFRHQC